MTQRANILLVGGVLALALSGIAVAGPLEDGNAAYERGDYAAAMNYWRPLADGGNADAQFGLGTLYINGGGGVPRDYARALAWYRKAADQGNAGGQASLGVMYAAGLGVPRDYAQAHMWFNLSASRATEAEDRDSAAKNRDELAAKMTPDQITEAQRLAREWKPTK